MELGCCSIYALLNYVLMKPPTDYKRVVKELLGVLVEERLLDS